MQFVDAVSVTGTRRTGDGYLIANARSVRTGIQLYAGAEIGLADKAVARVYRPAEEVFAQDSLQSFSHAPVTVDHPAEPVTADNWRRLSVGEVSTAAKMDGEWVSLPLILKDSVAIQAVESGKRQLSAGYVCRLDLTPGITADGQSYDAVQREIRINHLALVDKARAGPRACIGDSWSDPAQPPTKEEPPMAGNLRTVLVDGLSIEVTDQGAQAIEKLTRQLGDANDKVTAKDRAIADAAAAHATAIQTKDGEIAALKAQHRTEIEAKDGEIAATKALIPDAAALDALATARADLIGKAKATLGDSFDPTGKPDAEIRRAVVTKTMGDAAKDMTDAEIGGAFKVVSAGKVAVDPVRGALRDNRTINVGDAAAAHAEMLDRMSNAWKHTDAKGNA